VNSPEPTVGSRLIFLVGARRSGTNWLHSLLGLHPQLVNVPSETHLFYTLAELSQRFQHGVIGSPNTGAIYVPRSDLIDGFRSICDRAFEIQLQAAAALPDARLVERTPLHAQHLDLIAEIYPDAPVIHLIRDGRDVARSLVRQPWGPATLTEAAQEWVDTVSKARRDRPAHYLEVRHEDLVGDVVATMSAVWEFLGLSVPPSLATELAGAAARPVNRTAGEAPSITAAELAEIEAVAGELLGELGYPAVNAESKPARSSGRWKRSRDAEPPVSPAEDIPWDELQFTVDRTMAAIANRDAAALTDLFSPTVEVRLRDTGQTMRGTETADGVARTAVALIEAASPHGSQIRGDSFPGRPSFTIVWTHDDRGSVAQRVFVVSVSRAMKVTAIDFYRLA
jgi:hypothetical protein